MTPGKFATPATAVTGSESGSGPFGPETARPLTTPLKLVATLPAASRASTRTPNRESPAICVPNGVASTSDTAGPGTAVAVATTGKRPSKEAVMLCTPSGAPSVHAVRNSPALLVLPVDGDAMPPPVVMPMLIGVPMTRLPNRSATANAIESVSAVPTIPVCAFPASRRTAAGDPLPMLKVALAAPLSPGDDAFSTQLLADRSTVRSPNDATPATAFTVVVPPSTAAGGPLLSTIVTGPANPPARFPSPSRAWTTHPGVIGCPAVPAPVLSVKTSWLAAPAVAVAVKVRGEPESPSAVAVTVTEPATPGSVSELLACPAASVTPEVRLSAPPPEVIAQLTVVPATGLANASVTRTTNGAASAVVTAPD